MSTHSGTFRNLDNYKSQHAKTAESKGVKEKFLRARTLTVARGLLFGFKSKRGNRDRNMFG